VITQATQAGTPQPTTLTQGKGGVFVAASGQGVPTNAAELRALRAKRSELSSQIQNVASRREELADQLRETDPGARKGLEERIRVIDERIVKLEKELASTGEALANSPASLLASETTVANQGADFFIPQSIANDIVPIVAILSVFVLGPMAIALSRFIWRRAGAPPQRQVLSEQAAQQRLDQLQQAVDTIAIEVERISEGQRFISKALADRALPAGSDARAAKATSAKIG
jgi:hypothetical protein